MKLENFCAAVRQEIVNFEVWWVQNAKRDPRCFPFELDYAAWTRRFFDWKRDR